MNNDYDKSDLPQEMDSNELKDVSGGSSSGDVISFIVCPDCKAIIGDPTATKCPRCGCEFDF